VERMSEAAKEKSGVFTGSYAINPVNGAKVPVWIADYVLMGYGTGAIMAVPAHDERDYEFAQQYHLPIPRVIAAADGSEKLPYTGDGKLINSPGYDGMDWADAKKKISADLAAKGIGKATINYKLRDWLFSRQRFWGEPFPIVWVSESDYRKAAALRSDLPASPVTFVENGVTQFALPLPETSLPLTLPETQSYLPSGTGESPLANVTEWLEIWFNVRTGVSVPASQTQPAGDAWVRGRRETNTMPQWAGSCWYYLRYLDPQNAGALASPEALKYWGVPDLYVGGAEHAVLHLLYARFWHKVLFDLGVVPQAEPFKKLFHQGIILGEDGVKMSKSRGNVVNPDDIIREYGADTLRLYLMFLGPLEAMKPWNPKGIEGVHRFLKKVWRECLTEEGNVNPRIVTAAALTPATEKLLHETIKKVGDDFDGLRFNTAISQLMILVNALQKEPTLPRQAMLDLLRLVAPLAPHLAEELWAQLGETGSVMAAGWPVFDAAKLVASTVTIVIQVNGKHRGDLSVAPTATEEELTALALQHDKAGPHLSGKAIRRTIYVKGRLINIIV
ncbi:MAG: leucyl-tRNA synthetase, partial [Verrucomicrobiota bacterium]|nr:leucyl-tRNA synthetase [Verrucomicrobiota bacterium]